MGLCAGYDTSDQRREELPAFLFRYNWNRPHGGINGSTPISHLRLIEDNLLKIQSYAAYRASPRH